MLSIVNDFRVMGEGVVFETKLPKSFLGLLISSLKDYGVSVKDIYDKEATVVITTSHGVVTMRGGFSVKDVIHKLRNEVYGMLNERFDKRVDLLHSKGFHYYREYTCFAKSEKAASIGNGIPNAAIMHADDFMFKSQMELL